MLSDCGNMYDERRWRRELGDSTSSPYAAIVDDSDCDISLAEKQSQLEGKIQVIVKRIIEKQKKPSLGFYFLWPFLYGIGSLLNVFPPPGSFDRWRMKESVPENELAMLFREIFEGSLVEKPATETSK